MTTRSDGPTPPSDLPSVVADPMTKLSVEQLQAAIEYADALLAYQHQPISDLIEPAEGEEIIRVEEQPAYALVVKKQPCPEGCEKCPHGPYAYHVTRERQQSGDMTLHWSYLGEMKDADDE